ncbi:endonuclease VII domain-containing protein [Streptomyces gobiensis]|uniref:endonuclease VII domain-containing protein n=1 Tax=Streptomyces gobiensis TaxID=2875706 RepID=UPI001E5AC97C|nr:endonuclease VII domain-containing protein [Streptomyces gobiensis]UGY90494.1 endonuclease VII domain-containing protein [Streptomyces gobiensis]
MSDFSEGKKCSRCKRTLRPDAFAENKSMRDGLQAYCRECSAEYYRQRQEARGLTVRERIPVPRGHKRCPQCGEVKPHSEWERNRTSSDGWASYCRTCRAHRNRDHYFRRKYGLSQEELQQLLEEQVGVCVICLAASAEHVDHDHRTGKVRGVLCFSCNAALGQFKDRPDAIRRAAAYVEGNVWKPTLVAPGVYRLPS